MLIWYNEKNCEWWGKQEMEVKIAILDDEKIYVDIISKIIKEYEIETDIILDGYLSSKALFDTKKEYDILLIDVELNEIRDGFEVAKLYRDKFEDIIIIFVSSHQEFSRDGYKVSAFRYVYKLRLEVELKEAIEASFKLLIRKGDMNVKIPWFGNKDVYIKDIVYIETCNRNLKIHLKKQSLVICETIREMKKVLEKKVSLARINLFW